MEGHNELVLKRLLADPFYTEAVKNSFKSSKHAFDVMVKVQCRTFKEQFAIFNSTYVQLEKPAGELKHSEVKFLPRNFTLYSLAQRQLLKGLLQKNRVGFSLYRQACGSCYSPSWKHEAPVSTLGKVFGTISHELLDNAWKGEKLEQEVVESVEMAAAFHPLEVEADRACFRKLFPTLPTLLLEDLFTFLWCYAFEDLLVFARGPNPDNDYIDIDNFFQQFYCHRDILIPLPHAEWDHMRDYLDRY